MYTGPYAFVLCLPVIFFGPINYVCSSLAYAASEILVFVKIVLLIVCASFKYGRFSNVYSKTHLYKFAERKNK